jgi:hypothetical protein
MFAKFMENAQSSDDPAEGAGRPFDLLWNSPRRISSYGCVTFGNHGAPKEEQSGYHRWL